MCKLENHENGNKIFFSLQQKVGRCLDRNRGTHYLYKCDRKLIDISTTSTPGLTILRLKLFHFNRDCRCNVLAQSLWLLLTLASLMPANDLPKAWERSLYQSSDLDLGQLGTFFLLLQLLQQFFKNLSQKKTVFFSSWQQKNFFQNEWNLFFRHFFRTKKSWKKKNSFWEKETHLSSFFDYYYSFVILCLQLLMIF